MIDLPNPFQSALDPATGADTVAGPSLTDPSDPTAVTFASSCGAQGAHQSLKGDVRETKRPETDVGVAPGPRDAKSPSNEGRSKEASAAATQNPAAAGLLAREDYIPELFSVFARRRCMPIISPPLAQQCRREFEPDMDALFDAIVPPEPPPLFIRKPSEAFMRALFELSH